MLRVLVLGWLGSGVSDLLVAEAGIRAVLSVSRGQPGFGAQYRPAVSPQSTAKPAAPHHLLCPARPCNGLAFSCLYSPQQELKFLSKPSFGATCAGTPVFSQRLCVCVKEMRAEERAQILI